MKDPPIRPERVPAHGFPRTKFHPPRQMAGHVERTRLRESLARAVAKHTLTLIAAPAGSGKTRLASTLAQSDRQPIWIALDEADNELRSFVAVLVSALRDQLRDSGEAILQFLSSVPNAHDRPTHLANAFINGITPDASAPVIVLDDYHVITDERIHAFLAHLIDYLPDDHRVVLVSRYDPPLPLSLLRARGQLAEFRLPQLHFGPEETAVFVNDKHGLRLTPDEVARLHQRTEGWVAALQLLVAVLANFPDRHARSAYVESLPVADPSVFALLADEVFTLQPPEVQTFLLQTSVLPELDAAACRVVTGDSAAADRISDVLARNLFLTALSPDMSDERYRYHDLFAEFLRHRLKRDAPEMWRELHRRAASVAASIDQALAHWIYAESWESAADLLETMIQSDSQHHTLRRSIVSSIEALPDAIRQSRPWLMLVAGRYYAMIGRIDAAMPLLHQADAQFRKSGDERGEIEVLAARAIIDMFDSDGLIEGFERKIELTPQLMRPDHWVLYHGAEQWHGIAALDWSKVMRHLQDGLKRAAASGDPETITMASMTIGPESLFGDNGMKGVEDFARLSLRGASHSNWVLRACGLGILGYIHFFRGQIDDAERCAREARRLLADIGGLAWISDHVNWLNLSILLVRRAYHTFSDFLADEAGQWGDQYGGGYPLGYLYLQGRAFWLQGRTADAQAVLNRMNDPNLSAWPTPDNDARKHLLSALIAISKGEGPAALSHLRDAITLHKHVRHTMMLTHPRLTLATLYGMQGRWDESMDELRTAVREVKARGMPGVILQEGESIVPVLSHAVSHGIERDMLEPLLSTLQSGHTPQPIRVPDSGEVLTVRELEVLRLLPSGLTNRIIADRLSITERTVKAHLTRILAKLDAANRTEAVSKARKLGLV